MSTPTAWSWSTLVPSIAAESETRSPLAKVSAPGPGTRGPLSEPPTCVAALAVRGPSSSREASATAIPSHAPERMPDDDSDRKAETSRTTQMHTVSAPWTPCIERGSRVSSDAGTSEPVAPVGQFISSVLCDSSHPGSHSSASSRPDSEGVWKEFVREATNEADVPPGLLRFLQQQKTLQQQQQQPASCLPSEVVSGTGTTAEPVPRRYTSSNSSEVFEVASGACGSEICWLAAESESDSTTSGMVRGEQLTQKTTAVHGVGALPPSHAAVAVRIPADAMQWQSLCRKPSHPLHPWMLPASAASLAVPHGLLPEKEEKQQKRVANGAEGTSPCTASPAPDTLHHHLHPHNCRIGEGRGSPGVESDHRERDWIATSRRSFSQEPLSPPSSTQLFSNAASPSVFWSFQESRPTTPHSGGLRGLRVSPTSSMLAAGHAGGCPGICTTQRSHQPEKSLSETLTPLPDFVGRGSIGGSETAGRRFTLTSSILPSSTPPLPSPLTMMAPAIFSIAVPTAVGGNSSSRVQPLPKVHQGRSLCSSRAALPSAAAAGPRLSSPSEQTLGTPRTILAPKTLPFSQSNCSTVGGTSAAPASVAALGKATAGAHNNHAVGGGPSAGLKGSCCSLGASSVQLQQLRRFQGGSALLSQHYGGVAPPFMMESGAGLIDVAVGASVSGLLSSSADTEPSLTAGVAWVNSLSSCPTSTGTVRSPTNYGYSGVYSNSLMGNGSCTPAGWATRWSTAAAGLVTTGSAYVSPSQSLSLRSRRPILFASTPGTTGVTGGTPPSMENLMPAPRCGARLGALPWPHPSRSSSLHVSQNRNNQSTSSFTASIISLTCGDPANAMPQLQPLRAEVSGFDGRSTCPTVMSVTPYKPRRPTPSRFVAPDTLSSSTTESVEGRLLG